MYISNNKNSNATEIEEVTFANVTIPKETVAPVSIDFDPRFNFYGYKVVNDKKKVFCVGEDFDASTQQMIFYMYNTETDSQEVTPIRKVVHL